MNNEHLPIYALVMAGGEGLRFWPASPFWISSPIFSFPNCLPSFALPVLWPSESILSIDHDLVRQYLISGNFRWCASLPPPLLILSILIFPLLIYCLCSILDFLRMRLFDILHL